MRPASPQASSVSLSTSVPSKRRLNLWRFSSLLEDRCAPLKSSYSVMAVVRRGFPESSKPPTTFAAESSPLSRATSRFVSRQTKTRDRFLFCPSRPLCRVRVSSLPCRGPPPPTPPLIQQTTPPAFPHSSRLLRPYTIPLCPFISCVQAPRRP